MVEEGKEQDVKIAVVGYGRMGRLIREKALARGHSVTAIIDPVVSLPEVTAESLSVQAIETADVVIDFSLPLTAVDNIAIITAAGKRAVIGTTGWYERLPEVQALVDAAGTGLIWSGNFSIGINLLFHILQYSAKVLDKFPEYDCMIHEYHHRGKADSPSGTAEMLGRIITDGMRSKRVPVYDRLQRRIEPEELHISSTRGGSIPGTHTITFDSEVDTIELTHRARNREGFASGAVAAAEWIAGRTGCFDIAAMMQSIIGH